MSAYRFIARAFVEENIHFDITATVEADKPSEAYNLLLEKLKKIHDGVWFTTNIMPGDKEEVLIPPEFQVHRLTRR